MILWWSSIKLSHPFSLLNNSVIFISSYNPLANTNKKSLFFIDSAFYWSFLKRLVFNLFLSEFLFLLINFLKWFKKFVGCCSIYIIILWNQLILLVSSDILFKLSFWLLIIYHYWVNILKIFYLTLDLLWVNRRQ